MVPGATATQTIDPRQRFGRSGGAALGRNLGRSRPHSSASYLADLALRGGLIRCLRYSPAWRFSRVTRSSDNHSPALPDRDPRRQMATNPCVWAVRECLRFRTSGCLACGSSVLHPHHRPPPEPEGWPAHNSTPRSHRHRDSSPLRRVREQFQWGLPSRNFPARARLATRIREKTKERRHEEGAAAHAAQTRLHVTHHLHQGFPGKLQLLQGRHLVQPALLTQGAELTRGELIKGT